MRYRSAWFLSINSIMIGFVTQCSGPDLDQGKKGSQINNIFGEDKRQVIDKPTFPFTAMGRLDNGCTGTLVSPLLVLTAANCVMDNKSGRVRSNVTYFRPAYSPSNKENKIWISDLWVGTYTPEDKRPQDFAFLKLATPATGFGFMAISKISLDQAMPIKVALGGYSTDKAQGHVLSYDRDCAIMERVGMGDSSGSSSEKLFHDCDSVTGVSGGALFWYGEYFKQYEIVGVTVSEYRNGAANSVARDSYSRDYANVAIPARNFEKVGAQLLAQGTNLSGQTKVEGAFTLSNPNHP